MGEPVTALLKCLYKKKNQCHRTIIQIKKKKKMLWSDIFWMKKIKTKVNSRSLCWKIVCMSCIKFKFKNWLLMHTTKIQYLIYLWGINHKNWYILEGHIPIVFTDKPTILYRNNFYSSKWNSQNIWWLIYQILPCSLDQRITMQSN